MTGKELKAFLEALDEEVLKGEVSFCKEVKKDGTTVGFEIGASLVTEDKILLLSDEAADSCEEFLGEFEIDILPG